MTDPTIPVLGLAVIDSLNPSALAMTLWLLSRPGAVPRVIAYVGGIVGVSRCTRSLGSSSVTIPRLAAFCREPVAFDPRHDVARP